MRICIFGAGAIGGFMAARLAAAGNAVTLIARGAQRAAIAADGLRLKSGEDTLHVRVAVSDDPAAAGPQDLVVIAVKTPALGAAAQAIAPLRGPEIPVMVAMNGIPWWFMDGLARGAEKTLRAADPDGSLVAAFAGVRLIGCVLHVACSVPEPGAVIHHAQNRLPIGAPEPSAQPLAAAVAETLAAAGIGAEAVDDIRAEVWRKVLGNLNFGPVSLLTRASNDRIAADPGLREICIRMFEEADRVGRSFGLDAGMTAEARVDLGGIAGFKTSMLQDFERARPVELESIVGAVREMGDIAGIGTPIIDTVYALAARAALEAAR